jgi:hypothetical protein
MRLRDILAFARDCVQLEISPFNVISFITEFIIWNVTTKMFLSFGIVAEDAEYFFIAFYTTCYRDSV